MSDQARDTAKELARKIRGIGNMYGLSLEASTYAILRYRDDVRQEALTYAIAVVEECDTVCADRLREEAGL